MLEPQSLLLVLRILVVVCGLVCVVLGFLLFRVMVTSNADLKLKLGDKFSRSLREDLLPGSILLVVGIAAIAVAYFCDPLT